MRLPTPARTPDYRQACGSQRRKNCRVTIATDGLHPETVGDAAPVADRVVGLVGVIFDNSIVDPAIAIGP
jgi:hypothetical protein